MTSPLPLTPGPEAVGIDPRRVEKLVAKLRGFVETGELPSAQLALARRGRLAALASFGEVGSGAARAPASNTTLYLAFSTSKAVVASAVWLLLEESRLRLADRVADHVPEFAGEGKDAVLIEHLLTHTAGFPDAPFDPLEWEDRERRLARFASWRLDSKPGERFRYHGLSSFWVLAELIDRASGMDFRELVRRRISEPLGLPDLHLGLPAELNRRVADIVAVGTVASSEETAAAGLTIPSEFGGEGQSLFRYNRPELRAVGVPGGGVITNAASLALFYQALLEPDGGGQMPQIWRPDTLSEARRVRTGALRDPMTGRLANRGLGLVIAGDDDRVFRAFAPANSAESFGHAGAGGQIAWADPATGISFAFLSNGCDRNPLRMGGRGLSLSNIAARCALAD